MPATVMSRYGYPKVPGDSPWGMTDVTGPTSYTQLAPGTPPTGGQVVTAADFGLQSLDWVGVMGSDNAQYRVLVVPLPFNQGSPFPAVALAWYVAGTGLQAGNATNLSARTVRLVAIGR